MQKNQPSDTKDCELAVNNTPQEKKLYELLKIEDFNGQGHKIY